LLAPSFTQLAIAAIQARKDIPQINEWPTSLLRVAISANTKRNGSSPGEAGAAHSGRAGGGTSPTNLDMCDGRTIPTYIMV
jgi:hypothetical protein